MTDNAIARKRNEVLAQLEAALDQQVINAVLLGSAAAAATESQQAIFVAKGLVSSTSLRTAKVLHDEFTARVRQGLSVYAAAAAVRRCSPGREAFAQFVHESLDWLEKEPQ